MGANLKSLEIVISNSKGRAAGVGLGTAKVGSLNVLAYLAEGTKDVFSVGSSIDVVGKFGNNSYVQTIDGPLELYNKSRTTADGYYYNTIDWNDGDGGECTYTDSALAVPQSITMNGQTIDFTMRDINGNSYGQWVNGGYHLTDISDPVAFNGAIQAFCHHIKTSVGNIDEGSRYALRYPTCTLRVLDASTINGYRHVVFGFETNLHQFSGSTSQTVGTVFELAFKVQSKGKLSIMKKSANPDITDNNPCYSLKGAEYGVYKTEADAKADKNKVNTLIIGKYDNSEKYKNWSNEIELEAGTYYVKETKAPKGYALNPNAVKVVIEAGKNTWLGEASSGFEDYPQSDPVGILLGKIDKETNKNKPQGSASLAGAEFTVKYYKGLYDSDPAKSGQTPARSWVLKTNSDGFAYLESKYKVSGDDFYYNGSNAPAIPVGTITIQETKAPTGYFINNEVFVEKITSSGSAENVHTYNQPKVLEKVIKFDIKKVQAGTSTPVAGAVFLHTMPNGSTKELTTNGSGEITITGLSSGTHKIKEIKSPDGYQLNPNEVVFNVASGTGKITFTSGTNSLVTHGTKDSGDGYATFSDKVNPFNLKITKTNEHGKVLKGAEFTLYSDKDCTKVVDTQVSDENGVLSFKDLKVETTYYFKETKAPKGYRIPVDENGNVKECYFRMRVFKNDLIYDTNNYTIQKFNIGSIVNKKLEMKHLYVFSYDEIYKQVYFYKKELVGQFDFKLPKINPDGKKKFSDYKISEIISYCVDNLMDIRDLNRYKGTIEKILKEKTNYQEFLETMAYLDLIVNRNCTPPTIVGQYLPVAGSIDDKTDAENKAQYIKIKSSILGIRYTYNENGKLLISGPRKAPGKYSKIKKEKFSWKICSDVLQ